MPRSNWKETRLGDLISIKHGFAFPGKNITDLETDNILATPGHFNIGGGFKNVHKKFFNGDVNEEYILKEGDLIITMTDLSKEGETLGYSAIVPKLKNKKLLHNQRIGKVKIYNPDIQKNFLYYLLRDKHYRHWVLSTSTGSTVRHTSPKRIQEFKFFLPSIEEQAIISEVLLTLDSKIELNQQMNKNLEDIAKTLFKSWFIDFDPVKAKVEGRLTGLSQVISDLFPSSFEDTELGEIPTGWHKGNIEDIAEKISDKYKQEEDWSNEKLIDLSRMPSNSIALNSYGKGKELSTSVCKFQKYDFLFGSIRPYFYKAGICPFDGVSNTSVFILRAKNNFDREFVYFYSSSEKTFDRSVQYSAGTKMPIIKWNDFKEFKFALPSEELRKHFSSEIRPIVDKIILNIEEQETLTKLRDSLLPKLISGELNIPDAESLIEETSI